MNRLYAVSLVFLSTFCAAQSHTIAEKRLTNVIDSYPMLSRDGTRIVFESNRTGNWEIFSMNKDGSDLHQLTNNTVEDVTPCWSPDGKKIVFASGMDSTSDIFIMNADGSDRKKLTDIAGDDSHPHFSADGKKIIFNSARTSLSQENELDELFIMDSDGKNQKQLTHLKGICTFPNLSPDGRKIVFRRVLDSPGFNWDLSMSNHNSEIFLLDLSNDSLTNISNNAAFDGWPSWAPDGKSIVYASNRLGPANVGQLFLYNLALKTTSTISTGPVSHAQPSFSPDGKEIVCYEVYETSAYEFGSIVQFDLE